MAVLPMIFSLLLASAGAGQGVPTPPVADTQPAEPAAAPAPATRAVPVDPAATRDPDAIVVTADRAVLAETGADLATLITLRPPKDVPLPRRYTPVCPHVFGVAREYGDAIAARIIDNLRSLNLQVAGRRCQPNALVAFVTDSEAEVARLRKAQPEMFAKMKGFEVDRIFRGSGAVQAWHATEMRNADGRPFRFIRLLDRDLETVDQYSAGRLVSPIRNDVNATIVLFDRARADGLTVQQLADHATFRLLAGVQDRADFPAGAPPSILHLFARGAPVVDGLTEFDWAYLAAYYKLGRGATAPDVHDATRRMILTGAGQKLRDAGGQ